MSIHRFQVAGTAYNPHPSTIARACDEVFEIEAESVGDALNELVNRSGMWDAVDMEEPFSIKFLGAVEEEMRYVDR